MVMQRFHKPFEMSSILIILHQLFKKEEVHNIYWTEDGVVKSKIFNHGELGDVLDFSENLRRRRREGSDICFITISSENPNMVGQLGVDVTGPDYDWKKRRI